MRSCSVQDAEGTSLMGIGGCLKVREVIIDMAPQMLIVSAQHSIEAVPKDDAKPVNKNQVI